MKTDNELHEDVLATLSFEPLLDISNVAIAVKNGVVTLSGEVPSHAELWTTEHVTKNVAGVRTVAQEIKVVLPKQHMRNDADIAEAAANVLLWDAVVPSGVKVQVADGWITLSGETKWQSQWSQAASVVRYLGGVHGVTNLIVIKTSPTTYNVTAKIQNAFYRHAGIDATRVSVDVNDQTATLHGAVGTMAEREDAENAAWMADGVNTVHNEIVVDPELSKVGMFVG